MYKITNTILLSNLVVHYNSYIDLALVEQNQSFLESLIIMVCLCYIQCSSLITMDHPTGMYYL